MITHQNRNLLKLDKPFALGRTAEVFDWQENQVLKLFFDWMPSESVNFEYKASIIVQEANLEVPKVFDIVEIDGRHGIIYEKIMGKSMLYQLQSQPLKLKIYAKHMADLHLSLHELEVSELPSKNEGLRRKISRVPLTDSEKTDILDILDNLEDGNKLCHGDFHPGNIMLTSEKPIIIDWQDVSKGHPLADIARTILLLKIGTLPANILLKLFIRFFKWRFLKFYLRFYFEKSSLDSGLLDRWMIPTAAARLDERISGEKKQLYKLIRTGLDQ